MPSSLCRSAEVQKLKPLCPFLEILFCNFFSISFPTALIVLTPMKEKKAPKLSGVLDHEPGQGSNMDNKLIVKNGQGRVLGDFANIVSALVPQANHT